MENTKMTYVEALTLAMNAVEDEAVFEKLGALRARLEAKAENRKPKVNAEKLALAEKALALMKPGERYRVAELAKELDVSTQKLTPAMGVLIDEGHVTKVTEKRVGFYTLVTE